MNNDTENMPPDPVVRQRSGPSLVWLIPLITALIGGWLVIKTVSEKGPLITLTFKTAEGIEAGKTKVKYKNIEIGVVEGLRFTEDFGGVILDVRMAKEASEFLRRDTRFWVVKPRLGLRGVSGLDTLISGTYIEIEPGLGARKTHFVGLESPPVVKAEEAGIRLVLMADRLGSIGTGSPIYYQGILAGEVLGYELANDRKSVFIHAFIKSPFDQLVRGNTRFWNVSGMEVSMSADGFNVHTESLTSLIYGGIAFETPEGMDTAREDVEGLVFTLFDSHQAIAERSFTKKLKFVLFFDGSVRGLNIGAPVEFKGIKVGSVTDIRLEFNHQDSTFRIPVMIEIEPQRVVESGEGGSSYQTVQTLVARGLRARLQTGSLLTGQLFVELDMRPETGVHLVGGDYGVPELPTIPAALEEITDSVRGILTRLEKVDFEAIGKELEQSLHGVNTLINTPELHDAPGELKASISAFLSILRKVDARAGPITENLEQAIGAGHETLGKLQQTLDHLNGVLKPDSAVQYRINRLAGELEEMARSIRALVDLLERNPQSVIFGKTPEEKNRP